MTCDAPQWVEWMESFGAPAIMSMAKTRVEVTLDMCSQFYS